MFEQIKSAQNVVAMRLAGKLSAADANASKKALDDALTRQGKLGLVVDMAGLADISAEGLASGVKADMAFYSHVDRFARVAFVSDKEWPHVLMGMVGHLVSSPQLKVFGTSELDAALQWAAQPADAAKGAVAKAAISVIRTDKTNVVGFEIDGNITDEAVSTLMTQLKDFLAHDGKLRMLVRVKHLGGFDLGVFMRSGLLSMKFAAIDKLERYAIVGAPGWMAKAVSATNPLITSVDMRNFDAAQEAQAWDWLGAKPAK